MKTLKVPYLPALDTLDVSSIGLVMETKARREYIDQVNWKEYPYQPIVVFDIARSNKYLYIRYFVKGLSVKAIYDKDDAHVHEDSCVEFFMQREGDAGYMNFEFNCIGTCDAARRLSRTEKTSLTPEEYASIKRHSSLERVPFAERTGLHAWELMVAIPLELMGLDPEHLPQKIRGNFYNCADNTEFPHFVSWSPIDLPEPNFHCPPFFGELFLD